MKPFEAQITAQQCWEKIKAAKQAAHEAFVAANRPALIRAFGRWTRKPEAALETWAKAGPFFGELGGPLCAGWEAALEAAEAATAHLAAQRAKAVAVIAAASEPGDGSGFSDSDSDAWSKH